jgi:hypothetical protein
MGKSNIAPGKKRHMLTLTESYVKRFQNLCRDIGLPPATLSNALDDSLKVLVDSMEMARKGGRFTVTDMFTMVGQQMELLQTEGMENGNKGRNAKVGKTISEVGSKAGATKKRKVQKA